GADQRPADGGEQAGAEHGPERAVEGDLVAPEREQATERDQFGHHADGERERGGHQQFRADEPVTVGGGQDSDRHRAVAELPAGQRRGERAGAERGGGDRQQQPDGGRTGDRLRPGVGLARHERGHGGGHQGDRGQQRGQQHAPAQREHLAELGGPRQQQFPGQPGRHRGSPRGVGGGRPAGVGVARRGRGPGGGRQGDRGQPRGQQDAPAQREHLAELGGQGQQQFPGQQGRHRGIPRGVDGGGTAGGAAGGAAGGKPVS